MTTILFNKREIIFYLVYIHHWFWNTKNVWSDRYRKAAVKIILLEMDILHFEKWPPFWNYANEIKTVDSNPLVLTWSSRLSMKISISSWFSLNIWLKTVKISGSHFNLCKWVQEGIGVCSVVYVISCAWS